MKHSLKVYFFLLAQVLVIYSALHASDVDKKQKKLNKEFLDVAELVNITSRKKYKRLSTLLVKKADIAATREITIGFDKVQASALTLVMRAANVRNSNDNASIFFLLQNKSPLNSWHPEAAPLRIAIQNTNMHAVIPTLAAARGDVNLLPSPTGKIFKSTYLHALAGMAPDEAVKIFNMLSPLGDVPVDNLDENGCSAMHIRQLKPESYYGQPKFAVLLAKYGADLLCSVSDCRTCESVHDMVQAAHEKWKAEASKKVLENIPVMALKDLVINCCFAKPKNLRLLYHYRLR